jgi:hypothetical protein
MKRPAAGLMAMGVVLGALATTHAQQAKGADKRAAVVGFAGNTPPALRKDLAATALTTFRGVANPTALEVLNCDGLRGPLEALGHDGALCDSGKIKPEDLVDTGLQYIVTGEAMDVAGTVYLTLSLRNGQGLELQGLSLQGDTATLPRELGRTFGELVRTQLQKDNIGVRAMVADAKNPPGAATGGKTGPRPSGPAATNGPTTMLYLLTQQNPGETTFRWDSQEVLGARILQDVLLQYGHQGQPAALKASPSDLKWLKENGNITEEISRASLAAKTGRSMWMRLAFKELGTLGDPPVRMVWAEGRAGLFHEQGKRTFTSGSYRTLTETLSCNANPGIAACDAEIRSRLVEPLVRQVLGIDGP